MVGSEGISLHDKHIFYIINTVNIDIESESYIKGNATNLLGNNDLADVTVMKGNPSHDMHFKHKMKDIFSNHFIKTFMHGSFHHKYGFNINIVNF